jgi:hypothetical protein
LACPVLPLKLHPRIAVRSSLGNDPMAGRAASRLGNVAPALPWRESPRRRASRDHRYRLGSQSCRCSSKSATATPMSRASGKRSAARCPTGAGSRFAPECRSRAGLTPSAKNLGSASANHGPPRMSDIERRWQHPPICDCPTSFAASSACARMLPRGPRPRKRSGGPWPSAAAWLALAGLTESGQLSAVSGAYPRSRRRGLQRHLRRFAS